MNRTTRLAVVAAALAICVAVALPAQNLLDNEFYRKARDLDYQAKEALKQGDYDRATSLAAEAKENLAKSDAYVERALRFYRANGWLNRANERIAYAKSIRADVNYREAYATAVADAAAARVALDAGEYEKSTELSRSAIAALEKVAPVEAPKAAATAQPTQIPIPSAAAQAAAATPPALPKYYTVRLIPERRDCFWFIAEYPFIYNDPWQWRVIYEANKSLIPQPDNPDWIEPGLVFTIPSLRGEKREGTYDPKVVYPTMPAAK